jgi:hypothetical protein
LNFADIQRDPKDNTKTKDGLEDYLWLAKITEKGKASSIFLPTVTEITKYTKAMQMLSSKVDLMWQN